MNDEAIEAAIPHVLRKVEATKTLYSLLLAVDRHDEAPLYGSSNYSDAEKAEANALHRRHLLRRVAEEARKAGIDL